MAYGNQSKLVAGLLFVLIATSCSWNFVLADIDIVAKAAWNGLESKKELTTLDVPVGRAVIAHTAGVECDSLESCSRQMRLLQNFHMETSHFDDIAYNFLVGNDGSVYEGRGWDKQGAFAAGYNAGSLGIAFIGSFDKKLPKEVALNATKSLLETGVALGKLREDYKLYGHRQLSATLSPGTALHEEIQRWPHWNHAI